MGYYEDLKKKAQGAANMVQKAGQTVKNTYEAAKNGAKNIYDAATGAQKNVYNAAMGQPSVQAPSQPQKTHEVDMAAAYDQYKAESVPSPSQGGQVAVSPAAQSSLGEGAGQWKSELDGIMSKIMNREKFSFDMNEDAMYRQYADIYANQANLGMQNAMAQAAALTGGYGSSYAQQVGQQAYAQQMQGLNEVGMDLYNQALNQYMMEGDQLAQQYEMLAAREQDAYNRSIDERNFEYQQGRDQVKDNQWQAELDRYLANDKLAAEQWDKSFAEDQRQYNENLAWDKEVNDFLYGEDGFYVKQREDEQAYNTAEREASQKYNSDEAQKDREQDDAQFDKLYGENGYYNTSREDEQKYQQGIHNDLYGYTDENGEYHEGYYEKEANKDREQEQNQFNAMYGYTDESGVYHEGYNDRAREDEQEFEQGIHDALYGYTDENGNKVSGYYEDMADKEFNQMYGPEGYMTQKDKQDQENWQAEFDREGEWHDEATTGEKATTPYEGGGMLDGQEVPSILGNVSGLTTTDTSFFDDSGKFKTAISTTKIEKNTKTGAYTTDNGNVTWNIGGKTETLPLGINPYTRSENIDTEYGTFENGYQPNNVASYYGDPEMGKLTKTKQTDMVNGIVQPVYEDGAGKRWIWDDVTNEYMEYGGDAITAPSGSVNDKHNMQNPVLRR